MNYLNIVADEVKDYDPQGRSVAMYNLNHRGSSELETVTNQGLDWTMMGVYATDQRLRTPRSTPAQATRCEPVPASLSPSGTAQRVRVYLPFLLFSCVHCLASICSKPNTPRKCTMEERTLVDLRTKVEKHIKNTYLKRVDAPVGVKLALCCSMELCE